MVSGVTIYGGVYSLDLHKIDNVKVEISTSPLQRDITENGSYSFIVPLGFYTITAEQYFEGELIASTEENITIAKEGDFVFDLILFPAFEEIEHIEELEPEDILVDKREWGDFIFIIIFLIILFILVYKFKLRPEEEKTIELKERLDDEEKKVKDTDKIIAFIEKEGGRVTQKDLRREFPYSEAKMSLMIAELEDQGRIKKIKKGRGNILILK